MSARLNLAGQKYWRLLAVRCVGLDKRGNTLWECACDCGNTKIISAHHLRHGTLKSCGCLYRERMAKAALERKSESRGRPLGAKNKHRSDVIELAERDGISRQAAWYRLRKRTGRPLGRPRTEVAEMAERDGISPSTAWGRLYKNTGKPRGRPPGAKDRKPREQVKRGRLRRGKPRRCFENACAHVVAEENRARREGIENDFRYVEGWAVRKNTSVLDSTHHAWVLNTKTGEIHEVTWNPSFADGCRYEGIVFTQKEMSERILQTTKRTDGVFSLPILTREELDEIRTKRLGLVTESCP